MPDDLRRGPKQETGPAKRKVLMHHAYHVKIFMIFAGGMAMLLPLFA